VLREGTRPKYLLRPAHEVPGCEGHPPRPWTISRRSCSSSSAAASLGVGTRAAGLGLHNPRTIAKALVRKGWARELGNNHFAPILRDAEAAARPDWTWLPNELVTGAAGEVPPVELVRQAQDVMTLRLLVDLYYAQNLCDDGGVSRTVTCQEYERSEVGRQAQFTAWGFRYENGSVIWTGPRSATGARS
jgi:hypothetical protein